MGLNGNVMPSTWSCTSPGLMASAPPSTATEDSGALNSLLRWPNVRRMLRTVCDLDDACATATRGSVGHAYEVLLANAPPEAKKILCYLGQCVGTPQRQRASSFQTWMQENQAWVRGRRFLGIPDICLPQPVPLYIDYNQELATASPALYDMYVQDLLRLLSYGSSITIDPDPYLDLFRWTDPAAGSPSTWFQQPMQTQQTQQQLQTQTQSHPGGGQMLGKPQHSSGAAEGPLCTGGIGGGGRGGPGDSEYSEEQEEEEEEEGQGEGAAASSAAAPSSSGETPSSLPSSPLPPPPHSALASSGPAAGSPAAGSPAAAAAAVASTSPQPPLAPSFSSLFSSPSTPWTGELVDTPAANQAPARASFVSITLAATSAGSPPEGPMPGKTAVADVATATTAAQLPALPPPPVALPFGSTGAAAAVRALCREVPGLGLVPERVFLRAPATHPRLHPLPHGDPRMPPDWKARLPPVIQWSHPALPWFTPTRGNGLVMAGGAALAMAVPGAAASDVDLFLVVPSLDPVTGLRRSEQQRRDAAWLVVVETLEAVQRQVSAHDRSLYVYAVAAEQSHTLDVLVTNKEVNGSCNGTNLVAQMQLVLRLYETPAQVIHGFDVDVCTLLYDGVELWAAGRALRALHCGFILVEPVRQSPSYEIRIHKYSMRLGLDILVPGLDPLLMEPVVQELDAMQVELRRLLAERINRPWVTSLQDREVVTNSFHRCTRIPTVRKLATRATGLDRLLLVRKLSELEVTPEEVKVVTSGYGGPRMTAADAAINKGQCYMAAVAFVHHRRVACTDLGRQRPLDDKDGALWLQLKKLTTFQIDGVHLQTGREVLFSGSFTHTPFDDWYRCCLNKLEERLSRGEIDWEARARERVVQEYDAVALACADDAERVLETKCRMYMALLAALRAGRPAAAATAGGSGDSSSSSGSIAGFASIMALAQAVTAIEPVAERMLPAAGQQLQQQQQQLQVQQHVVLEWQQLQHYIFQQQQQQQLQSHQGQMQTPPAVPNPPDNAAVLLPTDVGQVLDRPQRQQRQQQQQQDQQRHLNVPYPTALQPSQATAAQPPPRPATALLSPPPLVARQPEAAVTAAGAPGLAVGPRCCGRTGELLYLGHRYRLVATEVEHPMAATPGSAAVLGSPSPADATNCEKAMQATDATATPPPTEPRAVTSAGQGRGADGQSPSGRRPAAPQGGGINHGAAAEDPAAATAADVGIAAWHADSRVTAVVVMVAVVLAWGPGFGATLAAVVVRYTITRLFMMAIRVTSGGGGDGCDGGWERWREMATIGLAAAALSVFCWRLFRRPLVRHQGSEGSDKRTDG